MPAWSGGGVGGGGGASERRQLEELLGHSASAVVAVVVGVGEPPRQPRVVALALPLAPTRSAVPSRRARRTSTTTHGRNAGPLGAGREHARLDAGDDAVRSSPTRAHTSSSNADGDALERRLGRTCTRPRPARPAAERRPGPPRRRPGAGSAVPPSVGSSADSFSRPSALPVLWSVTTSVPSGSSSTRSIEPVNRHATDRSAAPGPRRRSAPKRRSDCTDRAAPATAGVLVGHPARRARRAAPPGRWPRTPPDPVRPRCLELVGHLGAGLLRAWARWTSAPAGRARLGQLAGEDRAGAAGRGRRACAVPRSSGAELLDRRPAPRSAAPRARSGRSRRAGRPSTPRAGSARPRRRARAAPWPMRSPS